MAEATQLFARLLADHPGKGDFWEMLGSCFERRHQFSDATHACEHALNLAVGNRAYIENQIAEVWGNAGERGKAFEWLRKAIIDAFEHRSEILVDSAFAKWHDDPEFIAVAVRPSRPT